MPLKKLKTLTTRNRSCRRTCSHRPHGQPETSQKNSTNLELLLGNLQLLPLIIAVIRMSDGGCRGDSGVGFKTCGREVLAEVWEVTVVASLEAERVKGAEN